MATLPEKCDGVKNISASQILNYLQKNNLTNEIFMEILSDLNNKKGFKSLRKMVEDLISSHEGQLYSPTTERSRRASIINEVCTVAFTIDTIFPNVLRMKFQNEFPNLVNDILEELKTEKKIDSYVPFVSSAIAGTSTPIQTIPASADSSSRKSASPSSPVQSTSRELPYPSKSAFIDAATKGTNMHPVEAKNNKNLNVSTQKSARNDKNEASPASSVPSTSKELPSPIKSITINVAAKKTNVHPVKSTQKATRKSKNKTSSESPVQSTLKELPSSTNSESAEDGTKESNVEYMKPQTNKNFNVSKEKATRKDENKDTDESDISTSVSSVHTSELSSFDEAISVSSEGGENGRKKKLTFLDIQQAYKSERISSWCAENFNGTTLEAKCLRGKRSVKAVEKSDADQSKISSSDESSRTSGSTKELSSLQKVLPRRIRKPNSKYVSDSIICPITSKQQKRMQDNEISTSDTAESHSPQKKKKIEFVETSDDEILEIVVDAPKKKQQASTGNKENSENRKSPLHSTSNVFKPFTSVRPLTSRKTAPMTLFSTQSMKK